MPLQYSDELRQNQLLQIESTVNTTGTATLRIFGGTVPANCAAAASATLLGQMNLPTDWLSATGSGATLKVQKVGTWTITATGAGTATHWRIYDGDGTPVCHLQGTVGVGTGDMQVDNTNIAIGQVITINTFDISVGNS